MLCRTIRDGEIHGHLVGHAHIDLQWSVSAGGIVFSHEPSTKLRVMDEFPGFTFSQSSSSVSDHRGALSELLRDQEKVKNGSVGGCWVAFARAIPT